MSDALIAGIPSPSSGALELGPLSIHAYGLMIALGVVAAVWLTGRRLEEKGVGKREDISAIALWAVPAGVIGARLYHVITDWQLFEDDLGKIFQIWKGGLGIPGGMLAGALVGIWRARTRGLDVGGVVDCAAPALPLAQAIGRIGNYFNQELYGKQTDLPWGLEIDDENAPKGDDGILLQDHDAVFHPTFAYEALWNLALCGALLWIDRRYTVRRGSLLAMYVVGYGIGRFWVEGLRIDDAKDFGGLRLNQWVALGFVVAALGYLLFVSGRPSKAPIVVAADEPILEPLDESAADVDPLDPVDPTDPVDAGDQLADDTSESEPEQGRRYVAEDG